MFISLHTHTPHTKPLSRVIVLHRKRTESKIYYYYLSYFLLWKLIGNAFGCDVCVYVLMMKRSVSCVCVCIVYICEIIIKITTIEEEKTLYNNNK